MTGARPMPRVRGLSYSHQYEILGAKYGVEDYAVPGEHFMPHSPHKRYRIWREGVCIGQADMLKDAVNGIKKYAEELLVKQRAKNGDKARKITEALALLAQSMEHFIRKENQNGTQTQ